MLLRATGDGVSVENEEELLGEEFGAPNENGIFGAPGIDAMVREAEKALGLGEPNKI